MLDVSKPPQKTGILKRDIAATEKLPHFGQPVKSPKKILDYLSAIEHFGVLSAVI